MPLQPNTEMILMFAWPQSAHKWHISSHLPSCRLTLYSGRPQFTLLARENHHSFAGTKLYC